MEHLSLRIDSKFERVSAHACPVMCASFSPCGVEPHMVATGSIDGHIRLWAIHPGNRLESLRVMRTVMAPLGGVVEFCPHLYKGQVVLAGVDGADTTLLRLWSVADGACLASFGRSKLCTIASISAVSFFPGPQPLVACLYECSDVKVWNLTAADPTVAACTLPAPGVVVQRTISASPHGGAETRYLLAVGVSLLGKRAYGVVVWSVRVQAGEVEVDPPHLFVGHKAGVNCCAWSYHDPNLLATGGEDFKIKLWDVERHFLLHTFSSHLTVNGLSFVRSNPWVLMTAGADGVLREWRTNGLIFEKVDALVTRVLLLATFARDSNCAR
jgi:WD40 repeat protein